MSTNTQNGATFCKVRFTSKRHGATAGLVIDGHRAKTASIADLSRLFPTWEANKMHTLECSPEFATFEQAFAHEFDGQA